MLVALSGPLLRPTYASSLWPSGQTSVYTIHSYVNVRKRFSHLHGHIGLKKPWIYLNLLIHPPLAFNNHSLSTYRWLYYPSWPSYVKNKQINLCFIRLSIYFHNQPRNFSKGPYRIRITLFYWDCLLSHFLLSFSAFLYSYRSTAGLKNSTFTI